MLSTDQKLKVLELVCGVATGLGLTRKEGFIEKQFNDFVELIDDKTPSVVTAKMNLSAKAGEVK